MVMLSYVVLCTVVRFLTYTQVSGQAVDTHGPPLVDRNPLFLDSYLPASMQIIAYVTELMKYEVYPKPSTTTPAPTTHSHKPGIFAPVVPTRPRAYHRTDSYVKLGETPSHPESGYFSRYKLPTDNSGNINSGQAYGWSPSSSENRPNSEYHSHLPARVDDDLELLGQIPSDLYKQINTIERDYDDEVDLDVQVQKFSEDYDDSNFGNFLRQKKIPPTRAYVTLLSLYDNLNKESKKLGLNKYSGYTPAILRHLAETSTGTSANQLHTVLSKIIEQMDTKDAFIIKKIKTLIEDLNKSDSYINDALRYIPPLPFDI